ncbi:MAG TPA: hypothetical protein VFS42_09340 [Burkholderiaceae bacterium]|nr:hypothetical protein [Burkholderiaceae bacterium]
MNNLLKWGMVAAAGYAAYKASSMMRARGSQSSPGVSLGLSSSDGASSRYRGSVSASEGTLGDDLSGSIAKSPYPTSADKGLGSSSAATI